MGKDSGSLAANCVMIKFIHVKAKFRHETTCVTMCVIMLIIWIHSFTYHILLLDFSVYLREEEYAVPQTSPFY